MLTAEWRDVCGLWGQTGAGKTHTMEGRPENPGLNARTLGLLFDLSKERAADWNFEVRGRRYVCMCLCSRGHRYDI